MHYYQHHLGDYAKDTGHLSLAEHGAYRMLLDHYYATESPLPKNLDALCRICRATSRAERQAVETVLGQFFKQTESAYTHGRVEKELAAKNQIRERNAENGRRGGRPKDNPKETQKKPSGLNLGSVWETQKKAIPLTSNQEPVLLEKETKGAITKFDLPMPPDWSDARKSAMTRWLAYKAEKKSAYKPAGWQALCTTLATHSDATIAEAVRQSMANNWQGLFPEKITPLIPQTSQLPPVHNKWK